MGASFTVLLVSVVARIIGLYKEIVIAKEFGLSTELDTFFLTLLIPMYLVVSFTNPLGPVFIPAFNKLEKEGSQVQQVLFSKILSYVVFGSLSIAVLFGAIIPVLDSFLNIASSSISLFQTISCLFIPLIVIQSISNYLLSFLENRKHFIFTSLGAVLSSIGILTCVSIVSNINSIAVGMLVSAFVFLLIEIFVISKKENIKLKIGFQLKKLEPKFKKQYYWLFFASLTMGSTFVVDQFMANYFGESSVSGLNFGYRLSAIISGLGALSLGAVALPVFSKLIADYQYSKIWQLLHSLLLVLFTISLPVIGLVYYFSDFIISVLFERGAFGMHNVSLVSGFLKMYIFQFPFYVAGVVLSRLMSSLGKNKDVFVISFIALWLNVSLNLLFTRWIGISGIALSTSVVYLFTFSALFYKSKMALNKIRS